MYGLKQSPWAWFERFTKSLLKFDYHQNQGDHALFIKQSPEKKITALIVYIDDIIVTRDDIEEMHNLKGKLAKEFEIKDLGNLRYFLGIDVARSKRGIYFTQRKYILDLLNETEMLGCKPAGTPIHQNHQLGAITKGILVDKWRYQRLVGRLIYLSHTRPDIAYAISMFSQFMLSPLECHMDAVLRILRYLKSTLGKGLLFSKNNHFRVEAYTDTVWANSITDKRSTSGYCTFVGSNKVTWRSKKQHVVARSSAKAEFRAIALGICELMLKGLLRELQVNLEYPMRLYYDNKVIINIVHNPVQHDRTKRVEIDRHFIKKKIDSGLICTTFVASKLQLADVLTKGVQNPSFNSMVSKLGMEDIFKLA